MAVLNILRKFLGREEQQQPNFGNMIGTKEANTAPIPEDYSRQNRQALPVPAGSHKDFIKNTNLRSGGVRSELVTDADMAYRNEKGEVIDIAGYTKDGNSLQQGKTAGAANMDIHDLKTGGMVKVTDTYGQYSNATLVPVNVQDSQGNTVTIYQYQFDNPDNFYNDESNMVKAFGDSMYKAYRQVYDDETAKRLVREGTFYLEHSDEYKNSSYVKGYKNFTKQKLFQGFAEDVTSTSGDVNLRDSKTNYSQQKIGNTTYGEASTSLESSDVNISEVLLGPGISFLNKEELDKQYNKDNPQRIGGTKGYKYLESIINVQEDASYEGAIVSKITGTVTGITSKSSIGYQLADLEELETAIENGDSSAISNWMFKHGYYDRQKEGDIKAQFRKNGQGELNEEDLDYISNFHKKFGTEILEKLQKNKEAVDTKLSTRGTNSEEYFDIYKREYDYLVKEANRKGQDLQNFNLSLTHEFNTKVNSLHDDGGFFGATDPDFGFVPTKLKTETDVSGEGPPNLEKTPQGVMQYLVTNYGLDRDKMVAEIGRLNQEGILTDEAAEYMYGFANNYATTNKTVINQINSIHRKLGLKTTKVIPEVTEEQDTFDGLPKYNTIGARVNWNPDTKQYEAFGTAKDTEKTAKLVNLGGALAKKYNLLENSFEAEYGAEGMEQFAKAAIAKPKEEFMEIFNMTSEEYDETGIDEMAPDELVRYMKAYAVNQTRKVPFSKKLDKVLPDVKPVDFATAVNENLEEIKKSRKDKMEKFQSTNPLSTPKEKEEEQPDVIRNLLGR